MEALSPFLLCPKPLLPLPYMTGKALMYTIKYSIVVTLLTKSCNLVNKVLHCEYRIKKNPN